MPYSIFVGFSEMAFCDGIARQVDMGKYTIDMCNSWVDYLCYASTKYPLGTCLMDEIDVSYLMYK